MAVNSSAPIRERPRRPSEWIALSIIGVLLIIQVVYLGLGLATRDLVIAAGTYKIDRIVVDEALAAKTEGWLTPNAQQEASATFQDVIPKFREHRPSVEVTPQRVIITVLVRSSADLRPMFESVGRRLSERLRSPQQLPPGGPLFELTNLDVKPYPWFKPLDFVSLVVLLGAAGAWVFLP